MQTLHLGLLAALVLAVTAFSAWRHYHPDAPLILETADETMPGDPAGLPAAPAPKRVARIDASDIPVDGDMDVAARKRAFFDALRPIVQFENGQVLELRARLKQARDAGRNPGWVRRTARRYGVDWSGNEWDELLRRVDAVPLTLALAQAANESSWGQSRFAQEGNNLFGMWCFEPGCGMVPKRRAKGKTHEVADYASVNESVRAYLKNINTIGAYEPLRRLREGMRQSGLGLDGITLAEGLVRYSERGQAYVDEIRAMIRRNRALMLARASAG